MEIEVVEVEPAVIVFASTSSLWDAAAVSQALGEAYGLIGRFMAEHDLQPAGPPRAMTIARSDDAWEFDAGLPIAAMPELDIDPASPVQIRQTEGGRTVRGISVGPYTEVSANWEKVRAWLAAHGYEESGLPWEEYMSDPGSTPDAELITHLNMPVE
mgnify:CR=1 FL=1